MKLCVTGPTGPTFLWKFLSVWYFCCVRTDLHQLTVGYLYHMTSWTLVNIDSGDGLLLVGTKPLPEPILASDQGGPASFSYKQSLEMLMKVIMTTTHLKIIHSKSKPLPTGGQWVNSLFPGRCCDFKGLAPVPQTIFQLNSKFDQNLKCPGLKYTLPIMTKCCTRHDSVTVVTCAKFRCDRQSVFETRALQILVEFRIRSKYR